MLNAWLKLIHQGDLRFRLGFTLCLFLSSQRVHLFLSVYINVCVEFECLRVKDGAREVPYTQARRWEYGEGGSRLKSLFLCQECAGQREDAVTFL